MSKSTTALRIALLASSSLGLAVIVSAVTPTIALAQATCDPDPAAVVATSADDSVSCDEASYTAGVTYITNGDLTVTTTVDAAEWGGDGIVLTAGADEDSITFDTDVEIEGRDLTGALLDVTTVDGAIDITTEEVDADAHSAAGVTHGILATSGTGDISITATGTVTASSGGADAIGIEARTGGDIEIATADDFRAVQGRRYGVVAETSGDSDLTFSGNAYVPNGSGLVALDLTTGMGLLTVNLRDNTTDNDNPNGVAAVRLTTGGGDAELTISDGGAIQFGGSSNDPDSSMLEINMSGGTTTIDNAVGAEETGFGSGNSTGRSATILRASGSGSIVLHNGGHAYGTFALGSFDGDFTLNNTVPTRGWGTRGQNVFSQGDDIINNMAEGSIVVGNPGSNGLVLQTTTLSFGAGDDAISNAGMIVVGENHDTNYNSIVGKTLEITGLERFDNSGLIVMGSYERSYEDIVLGGQTDLYYDDVIIMRDGHFHGEEGSRIWLDANFNNTGQTSCARNVEGLAQNVSLDDPEDGRLRANDCLDFRGSAVSGRTGLIIADVVAGDRGAYNPEGNVIVDVAGADPQDVDPEAFFIAPETPGYDAAGGFVDKGLFAYAIGYDAEDEAFKLYGVQSPSSLQLPLLGQAANDLWRTATSPWLEHRVAQRNAAEHGDLTTRFWVRGSLTSADRTVREEVAAGLNTLSFDNSYTQKDAALALGMDLGRGTAFGGEWVVGATAGYVQAKLSYDDSINTATFEGGSVGLYSGFTAGPFFHDVVINAALTNLLVDVPSLNLLPAGTLLETDVRTLGGHMETGWRLAFGPMRVEPLATLSWSQATFDSMGIPADDPVRFGGHVEFDDASSLRAGLGLRLGMQDIAPRLIPIDVHLTGRSMQEWDGEAGATIVNLGQDAVLTRAFDGPYNELAAGVSLGDDTSHVSGFLNVGGVWGEDYEARTGSVGVRLRW